MRVATLSSLEFLQEDHSLTFAIAINKEIASMSNRAESRFHFFANNRKNSVAKQERRTIHTFEPLEERQLLSVSDPIGLAAANAALCGSTAAPQLERNEAIDLATLDAVAESNAAITASEAETISSVDSSNVVLETRSSTGGTYRVFDAHGAELGVYTDGQISFTITIDAIVDTSKPVELTMQVWDVDYNGSGTNGQPERDVVSINGHQLDNFLTGANQAFSTCTFNVDPTFLKPGDNTVTIDIDTLDGGWLVECDWAKLRVVTDDLYIEIKGDDESGPPVTNAGVNFEVKSDMIDFDSKYEILGVEWEIEGVSGGKKTSSVSEARSENGKQWTWTPSEGEHGLYFMWCTVTLKDVSSDNTFQVDIEGDFEVFFDAYERTNPLGNPTNPLGSCPNWLYYWFEDNAVELPNYYINYSGNMLLSLLEDGTIKYDPTIPHVAQWDVYAQTLSVSGRCLSYPDVVSFVYDEGTHTTGGWYGADSLAHIMAHEYTHRVITEREGAASSIHEWAVKRDRIHRVVISSASEKYEPYWSWYRSKDNRMLLLFEYNGVTGPNGLREYLADLLGTYDMLDFYVQYSSDCVNDGYEIDQGRTSVYFTDTWNLNEQVGNISSEGFYDILYLYSGDNELYARLAEDDAVCHPENDWSNLPPNLNPKCEDKIIQYIGNHETAGVSCAITSDDAVGGTIDNYATVSTPNISVVSHSSNASVSEGILQKSSSENVVDNDGNNIYESFNVNTYVSVQNSGSYGLSFSYFDNEGHSYYHDFTIDLQSGTSELEMSIPISIMGIDSIAENSGIVLYLFDSNETRVGGFETLMTKDYSEYELDKPVSVDPIVVELEDANDNGLFDFLDFDCSLWAGYSCDVTVCFSLSNEDGEVIAQTYEERSLSPETKQSFSVSFDGNTIHKSGFSGPYLLSVSLFPNKDVCLWSDVVYTTEAYSVDQFEGAQAKLNNQFSEQTVDSDGDGAYDNLTISVGFDVAVPSNYRVYGRLVDGDGNIIESAYTYFDAEQGSNTVDLVYDSKMIAMNGADGPYTLSNLYLTDMNGGLTVDMVTDAYTTGAYSVDDFNGLKVAFTGEFDVTTPDDNNNGKYDSLDVSIGVNVNVSGNYRLVGYVYDVDGNLIDTISKREYLYKGSDGFNVSIPGPTINDLRANGPYSVRGLAIYDGDLELVTFGNSIETNKYQFDEFESQRLAVSDDITDYLDESGTYLCVTFKATSEDGGYYNANARLMDPDGAEICWASTDVTLVAGEETEITLKFNYNDVIRHGVPGELTVKDFSLYNKRNTSEAVYITEFHKTQYYGLNVPEWNLDDYSSYKSFKLDAVPDSNVTATLYGLKKDGKTYVELKAWDFVGRDAVATITGRNVVAENLWVTESAAALLGGVVFNGGDLLLDKLTLDGTAGDDNLTISTETVVTETQIFTTNPYEKALANYRKIYGESSPIYQKIAANLDAAYQKLSKQVTRKTTTWGVVELNGMTSKFIGTRDVAINTGAGDDLVQIDALHYNYAISTEGDNNELDFANAKDRVNVDLGANYRQCALIGDGGTLKLDGTFTTVTGTALNDRVVGSDAGLTFVGNGGSDSVTLVGGQNDVFLVGPRQSVVARGAGVYNVTIEQGDYSVVNAGGVTKRGAVDVAIEGKNVSVFGGLGTLTAGVEGDYATVSAGATQIAEIGVVGDHAVVTTGLGADVANVVGDYATVTTGAGNDSVSVEGAYASVNLGSGDDKCVLADGTSGKVGFNHVWGEAGNDAIVAAQTSGINYFYAGVGNDVIVGGAGEDYIYANAGDNILIGLGGVDRLYGGAGRDVLVASATDALANVDLSDPAALEALYAQAYQNWDVDKDLDATVQLLGEHCLADGEKDWLYRGSGRRNLIYASQLDADFENALERSPFNDVLKNDQR